VTSSNASALGLGAGCGVPSQRVDRFLGVVKAYSTRVGAGPFPTEQDNETGQWIRERGHEYGTTTGRPRRCGWFDAVAVGFTARLSGINEIAMMHLDTLAGLDTIQICRAYRIDGKETTFFPGDAGPLGRVECVYETVARLDGRLERHSPLCRPACGREGLSGKGGKLRGRADYDDRRRAQTQPYHLQRSSVSAETFDEKRSVTAARLGIHPEAMPRHIAIIMDGNGRWAQQRGLPRMSGHEQGGKAVQIVAQHCVDIGIEYLSLYSFSMQNWKRPEEEIDFLMHLIAMYLEGIRPNLMRDNVRLLHLGRRDKLPPMMIDALDETIRITGTNTGMVLGLALNYGSREEIVDAAKAIAEECRAASLIQRISTRPALAITSIPPAGKTLIWLFAPPASCASVISCCGRFPTRSFILPIPSGPIFRPEEIDKAVLAYAQRNRRFGDVTARKPH
jgi:undecaprenyl diphosphate synthase